MINNINKIIQKVDYSNESNNKIETNNNIKLNNYVMCGSNQKNKYTNDINFSLNKDSILNNEDVQLIAWDDGFKDKNNSNIKTIPKDYDKSSKVLFNSMREKRSFNT